MRQSQTQVELGWLVDRIPEVVARLSTDGEFLYVSAGARELYGREPEDLVGTNALDLVTRDERAEATRRLEGLAESEGVETRVTLNVARPDGNAIAVDIIGRSVRDPQSGELEIVSVAREATERLRAESALATAEERFRELVEWLPAVVYEADTGPDGAFHYVSPQITELLGYSADEWMSDPTLWRRRLHADEQEQVLELERTPGVSGTPAGRPAGQRVPDDAPLGAHGVGPGHRPPAAPTTTGTPSGAAC